MPEIAVAEGRSLWLSRDDNPQAWDAWLRWADDNVAALLDAAEERDAALARESKLREAVGVAVQHMEASEDDDRRTISSLVSTSARVRKHLERALLPPEKSKNDV